MGKLEGKVAVITGAARGQGRSHAVRMAEEGASIIAVDACTQFDTVPYPLASREDLDKTAQLVTEAGGPILTVAADVRSLDALEQAFQAGVERFGPPDIVIANAGIWAPTSGGNDAREWQETIDVNLTGVFNTVHVAAPHMLAREGGGAIVMTSSTSGLLGHEADSPGSLAYTASKHGVLGLMRCYANVLGPHSIRVNAVLPTAVDTPMIANPPMIELAAQRGGRTDRTALPVSVLDVSDVSSAIVWLVSDEARYVTGVALPVDAGFLAKK